MKTHIHRTLLLALSLLSLAASAQATEHPQVWLLTTATGPATQGFRWYGEFQPRYDVRSGDVERVLLRAAVGYDLPKRFSFWAGYGYTPLLSPVTSDEHRPFLQLLGEHRLGPVALVNRTRAEARFIEGTQQASLRARHMLRALYRLPDSQLGFAVYDEFFFNLNSVANGPPGGLDQNRLFAGVNYLLLPFVQIEGGYMWNYIWRSGAPADRVNHNLVLWLNLVLP